MRNPYLSLTIALYLLLVQYVYMQSVDFQSSNLPIIIIDSHGNEIVDEPKINAHMCIIYNGDGNRNYLSDNFNNYDGMVGIELRGFSSQTWPKKPFGFETRDSSGNNNNVSLLGLPPENDWTLHAPYVDKTLLRNVLMYQLATDMGMYAPRTRFCELILNSEYMGVYVLIEKIKRDKNRVDISQIDTNDILGGYLLEMTSTERFDGDEIYFNTPYSNKQIEIKYPKSDKITEQQYNYITDYFSEFESALYEVNFKDTANSYHNYIDLYSFIDNMLLAEGFNQLDVLSFSQFFHKDKNGKLKMGPIWDCNRSIGNARYYTSWVTSGWWLKHPYGGARALWAEKLMTDNTFMNLFANRWLELRESVFSFDSIYSKIDSGVDILKEARIRNFERWPVLGISINNKYAFDTYEEEINYIKKWIEEKFLWLDNELEYYLEQINSNLALFNLKDFSGQEEGNPADNALDGDLNTRWSSQGYPQWIEIELPETKSINTLELVPYYERKYQYIIEAKNNIGDNYEIIVDRMNYSDGGTSITDTIGSKEVKFIKLTINGCIEYSGDWVSILEFRIYNSNITDVKDFFGKTVSDKYFLNQSYPNPFNPTTKISFSLSQAGLTTLTIYNTIGQEITKLVDQEMKAGSYTIDFDGSNLTSGVYFYKIVSNNFTQVKKMMLIK